MTDAIHTRMWKILRWRKARAIRRDLDDLIRILNGEPSGRD
jgi:hypothetical protein